MTTRASFGARVLTDPVLVELILGWLEIAVAPVFPRPKWSRVPLAWWAALRRVNRTFDVVLMHQKKGVPNIWSCWLSYVDPLPSVVTGGVTPPLVTADVTCRVNDWLEVFETNHCAFDRVEMERFVAFAAVFMPHTKMVWKDPGYSYDAGRGIKHFSAAIAKAELEILGQFTEGVYSSIVEQDVFRPTIDVAAALGHMYSWNSENRIKCNRARYEAWSVSEYEVWCDATKASATLIKDFVAIVTNHLNPFFLAEDILKGMKRYYGAFKRYNSGYSHILFCRKAYMCEFYAQLKFCEVTHAFAAAAICNLGQATDDLDVHFKNCVADITFKRWLEMKLFESYDKYIYTWYSEVYECLQPLLFGPNKIDLKPPTF